MVKNNTKTIAIRISEDNYNHVENRAFSMHMSKNAYIEYVLEQDKAKWDDVYLNFKDAEGVTLYEHIYGAKPLSKA